MTPELDAVDELSPAIRQAAGIASRDWLHVFDEDALTARLTEEILDAGLAEDLCRIEHSGRVWYLLRLAQDIIATEVATYDYYWERDR